jgi:hypothetical protein
MRLSSLSSSSLSSGLISSASLFLFEAPFVSSKLNFAGFVTLNLANESQAILVLNGTSEVYVQANFTIYGNVTQAPTDLGPRVENYVANFVYGPVDNFWGIRSETWFLATDNYCPTITSPPGSPVLSCPNPLSLSPRVPIPAAVGGAW